MKRLTGKVVLVTGSATGIGEGIVRRAAAEGATVVIHGREEEWEAGERLAGELNGFFVSGELSDPEVPRKIVEAVVERYGRLDGLVNNAAVSWRGGLDSTPEFFDSVMAINARAPFLMLQAAQPHLETSKGSVVNIGSVNAHQTGIELTVYGMSKAAVSNLTRTLSGPFSKQGIRINSLNLGWTLTPNERKLLMDTSGWAEDWPEKMGEKMPFGRLMKPEDVAAMVCYLLSPEACMITGQTWDFDQRSHGR